MASNLKVDKDTSLPQEDERKEARETWSNEIDFLCACVGCSIGLGNVWRFPYLCYKNGGGAFLIPYLICAAVGGIPLFFLEVAVGQFMSQGGIRAWNLVPFFQGIGVSSTAIVCFLNCYYNVILAWVFYYIFSSFTSQLPWTSCDHSWNTYNCTLEFVNTTNQTTKEVNGEIKPFKAIDPTTEFWENRVLGISDGIESPGNVKWDICLCLLLAWTLVYLCIWKGIKPSGKIMYFTAPSPYIFMLILLVRGCTLDGAREGIVFYLVPDFNKLSEMSVWVDAGTQIFFSYSIALGALTALGSYNTFNHNSYRDSIIFACCNSGTSFLAGFVIFSVLGYMAHNQGVEVSDVVESGPGLAFIAYPKAVAEMPLAPLWSILFFLMLILLGIDSQFVAVEGLLTAIVDFFPHLRQKPKREIFIFVLCAVQFLVGVSMVTNGGMYVFQMFDYYTGSRIILLVAFFECIAVAYVYGVNRFYDNLEMMYGFRLNPWMKICWLFLSPIFCMSIFVMSAINYSELDYRRPSGVYVYPTWAVAIGWFMAAFCAAFVPGIAIAQTVRFTIRGKFTDVFKPDGLKPHQLRPQDVSQATEPYAPPTYRSEAFDMAAA